MPLCVSLVPLSDVIASRLIQIPGRSLASEVLPGVRLSAGWVLRRETTSNTWSRQSSNDGDVIEFDCRGSRIGLHVLRHRWSSALEVEVASEKILLDSYDPYPSSVYDTVFVIDGLPDGDYSIKLTNRTSSANGCRLGNEIWLMSVFLSSLNSEKMPKLLGRIGRDLKTLSTSDKLVSVHCKSTTNLGDRLSSPCQYFDRLAGVPVFDLFDWHPARQRDAAVREEFNARIMDSHIIVGGGGLLNSEVFASAIDYVTHASRKHIIIWGAGHNGYWLKKFTDIKQVCLIDHNKYSLVGIRDCLQPFLFCPCASAMHTAFDRKSEIVRPVGIYSKHERISDFADVLQRDPTIPIMTNDSQDVGEVVRFLSECATVITNSYHGAYWTALLGRRTVVCNPDSSKFFDMPFPAPFGHPLEWAELEKRSAAYPEALSEARYANEQFFQLVSEICGL
jgi:hypothetical protein